MGMEVHKAEFVVAVCMNLWLWLYGFIGCNCF